MIKNKNIKFLIILSVMILLVCVLPHLGFAQPQPGDPPPPPCTDPDDPACPIDGGLSMLIAAGVGYGVKKYRSFRKLDVKQVQL